jgi:nucleotide-binding universal stress UspA family protein
MDFTLEKNHPCPIPTLSNKQKKDEKVMLPFKKIMSPTDFSEPSNLALEAAIELAGHFSSELLLVHVVAPLSVAPTMTGHSAISLSEVMNEMRTSTDNLLNHMIENKIPDHIKASSQLLEGLPAEEISTCVKEENVDLIVISSHGKSGWKRLMFGSVTDKVMRIAACPVMIISPHKD